MNDDLNWDMPSIIDRLETIVDLSRAEYEMDKATLATEFNSMAAWLNKEDTT